MENMDGTVRSEIDPIDSGKSSIESNAPKRGRKSGKVGNGPTPEPGTDTGTDTVTGAGTTGRKPGRGRKQTKDSLGLIPLAPVLVLLHSQIAEKLGSEWEMEMEEAERIDKAVQEVLALYSIKLTATQAAWANLAFVLASCYGPRIYAANQRRKENQTVDIHRYTPEAPPEPDVNHIPSSMKMEPTYRLG